MYNDLIFNMDISHKAKTTRISQRLGMVGVWHLNTELFKATFVKMIMEVMGISHVHTST